MTLREQLDEFYRTYNIPPEGGVNDKTFEVPLPVFRLTLPNFPWRKRMLYIHDLEHILNEQDTTWPGEIFIASWEISTGFLRNFPVIVFPLWTMGWGLWTHPSVVLKAFRKGHTDHGIATLKIDYKEMLGYSLAELRELTLLKRPRRSKLLLYGKFAWWAFLSQLIFLSPIMVCSVIAFLLMALVR